jgi:hypothetical protein
MARPVSGTWRNRNEWSQKRYTRVELWRATLATGLYWGMDGFQYGNAQKVRDLDVVTGSITWDLANFVSSSMQVTVTTGASGAGDVTDAHGYVYIGPQPPTEDDLNNLDNWLVPTESYWDIPIETSWLVVYAGIHYSRSILGTFPPGIPSDREEIRLGVFRVTGITPAMSAGQTVLTAEDGLTHLTDSVIDRVEIATSLYNVNIANGTPWIVSANEIIGRGWAGRQVFAEDFHAAVDHYMVLAKDTNLLMQSRDSLLNEWATAAHGRFYMNSDGRICLRPVDMIWSDIPHGIYTYLGIFSTHDWNRTSLGVYTSPYQDDSAMSAIVELSTEFNRSDMYNAVVVEWENPNETSDPNYDYHVQGIAEDRYVDSPTYVNGPFGRRVLVVQDVPVKSVAEADRVAHDHLIHVLARQSMVTMKIPAYPAIEIGDWCELDAPGTFRPTVDTLLPEYFVQSVEYPLGPESLMTVMLKRRGG